MSGCVSFKACLARIDCKLQKSFYAASGFHLEALSLDTWHHLRFIVESHASRCSTLIETVFFDCKFIYTAGRLD